MSRFNIPRLLLRRKTDEWICPTCKSSQLRIREYCRICSCPRPSSVKPPDPIEGQWICIKCARAQSPRNKRCDSCFAPRPPPSPNAEAQSNQNVVMAAGALLCKSGMSAADWSVMMRAVLADAERQEDVADRVKQVVCAPAPQISTAYDATCDRCGKNPRNAGIMHGADTHYVVCTECAVFLVMTDQNCPLCRCPIDLITNT